MSRPSLDVCMLRLALEAARRTTCARRGVGCVLVNARGFVLAIAYNGVASGMSHCNEGLGEQCKLEVRLQLGANLEMAEATLLSVYPHLKGVTSDFRFVPNPNTGERAMPDSNAVSWLGFQYAPHACKDWDNPQGKEACEAVHAEQNALLQCSKPQEIETAYITRSPCKACLKLLLNTSCKRLVFLDEHSDPAPRLLWEKAGREWVQYPRDVVEAA